MGEAARGLYKEHSYEMRRRSNSKTPHQHSTSQAPSDIAAADPSGLPKGTAASGGGAARDGASSGQERQTGRKLSVKTRLSWAVRKDPCYCRTNLCSM